METVSLSDSSVFLCAMFYITFLSIFFYSTSVNVMPLSLPNFEKVAPHSKTIKRFSFCFFALAFSLFFHMFVDFRVPLALPPGPDWSHFGSIWVLFLIDFPKPESPQPQVFKKQGRRNSQRDNKSKPCFMKHINGTKCSGP